MSPSGTLACAYRVRECVLTHLLLQRLEYITQTCCTQTPLPEHTHTHTHTHTTAREYMHEYGVVRWLHQRHHETSIPAAARAACARAIHCARRAIHCARRLAQSLIWHARVRRGSHCSHLRRQGFLPYTLVCMLLTRYPPEQTQVDAVDRVAHGVVSWWL